jgi:hypothetical protein
MAMANTPDNAAFREGTGVLVKTRFDGKWASGFEIADIRRRGVVPPSYRIRRRSDHAVLPGLFPEGELRPER